MDRHDGYQPGEEDEPGSRQSGGDHHAVREGHGHSQGYEEQGDEEIADADDPLDHLLVVGEGGDGHPRQQRPHRPGETGQVRQAADHKNPGEGRQQYQLGRPRDIPEQDGEDVSTGGEAEAHQGRSLDHR